LRNQYRILVNGGGGGISLPPLSNPIKKTSKTKKLSTEVFSPKIDDGFNNFIQLLCRVWLNGILDELKICCKQVTSIAVFVYRLECALARATSPNR